MILRSSDIPSPFSVNWRFEFASVQLKQSFVRVYTIILNAIMRPISKDISFIHSPEMRSSYLPKQCALSQTRYSFAFE